MSSARAISDLGEAQSRWRRLARRVFALDPRSLALCRIFTGLVVLGDLGSRATSFRIHYTDAGILPRQALFELNLLNFPSIYAISGWIPFLVGLFLFHGLVATMFTLGYRTRINSVLLWYLTLSLQQRLYLANNGGDTVLISLLFWGMFLPWGETLSVDAGPSSKPRPPVVSVATAIVFLQVILLYWVSVFHKIEPTWLSGDVLYYAFQSDLYARPQAQYFLSYPSLMTVLAFSTVLWEVVGPLCLLIPAPRVRILACFAFAFMHMNFGLFLRLGIFGFSPALYMMVLLPSAFWEGPRARSLLASIGRGLERLGTTRKLRCGPSISPNRPVSIALCGLFLYTLLTSISQDERVGRLLPPTFDWIGQITGLYQRWGVFVNMPNMLDGWFVVVGQTDDGREIDLFQGGAAVRWDKPNTPFSYYRSFRWPTPLVVITGTPALHPWLVRALALDWQRRYPGQKVVSAKFYLMKERTLPDFKTLPAEQVLLWQGPLGP